MTVQHNACLAITGAIRGTLKEKLYDELGLESRQLHRWFRKLCYFYKLYKHEYPQYLFKLMSLRQSSYATKYTENIPLFKTKHNFSKILFLRQLLSSGTILTTTFEMWKVLVFLKTIS